MKVANLPRPSCKTSSREAAIEAGGILAKCCHGSCTAIFSLFQSSCSSPLSRKVKSLIVSSVTNLTMSVVTISRNLGADHDVIAAPAGEALGYVDEPTRLNGSFTFPSIYRGDPNDEIDAAWSKITEGKPASLFEPTRIF